MNNFLSRKVDYFILLTLSFLFISCSDNIKKGNSCLTVGDYQLAIYFYEQVLKDNPLSFEARLGIGKALLQQIADNNNDSLSWKNALMNLEAARNLHPSEDLSILVSEAWFARARMMLSCKDTIEALNALSHSIEINNKNVDAINSTGIIYFRKGEADKAEILFRKVIMIDSTNTAGFFNLGMVMWYKENYLQAKKYWLTASRFSPVDDDIVYWLAQAEQKMQEPGK
jgi:tetratricopeptide (TPR) repeat protein